MAKKSESEGKSEGESDGAAGNLDERKRLLARVAGHVASGIVVSPSRATKSAADVAEVSVEIAEAILQKIGL